MLKKILYTFLYIMTVINRKIKKNELENTKVSRYFLSLNNRIVEKKLKRKNIRKGAILLPHCVQKDDCFFKVTSKIDNCRECGRCKIHGISKLKKKYNIQVKVATGGTLARKFIKEERPDLVIAVACERDLISGIYDAMPQLVYGIFNEKINGPCYNTDFSIDEIEKVIKRMKLGGKDEESNNISS